MTGGDQFAFASGTSGTGNYGTATLSSSGLLTYMASHAAPAGMVETDSFQIVDTDSRGAQTTTTAVVDVDGGTAFSYSSASTIQKGGTANETVTKTSPEGGDQFAFVSGGTTATGIYGTATLNATTGAVSYTATSAPGAVQAVPDSFGVVDTDKDGARTNATATFHVQDASPPTATSFEAKTNENTAETITLKATDPNSGGSISSYTVTSLPPTTEGTLYTDPTHTHAVTANAALTSPTLYFVPTANNAGTGSFQYTATDNYSQTSAAATVTLDVAPVAATPTLGSETQAAATDETHVNASTSNPETIPTVAALPNGGYVIAWQDQGPMGSDSGDVRGAAFQIYNANGTKVGTQQIITNENENDHNNSEDISGVAVTAIPANTAHPNGQFLITYTGASQSDFVGHMRGQMFDAGTGAQTMGEFAISQDTTTQNESSPAAASFADGSSIVVWTDELKNGSYAIEAQRFNASGQAVGENGSTPGFQNFQVNIGSGSASADSNPDVAALTNGAFVVTLTLNNTNIAYEGSSSSGVSSSTNGIITPTGTNEHPHVAGLAGGGFAVAWTAFLANGEDTLVQYFNASSTNKEILVNTNTTGNQVGAAITALPDGGVLVDWNADGSDGSTDVYAQRLDASGNKVGGQFLVTQTTGGPQEQQGDHSAAVLNDGQLITVWDGYGNNGSGIYDRTFNLPGVGGESTPTTLTTVSAADSQSGDTLSIILTGFPSGTTFGVNGSQIGQLEGSEWVISSQADINTLKTSALTATVPTAGAFTLIIDAHSTETATLSSGSQTSTADTFTTLQVGIKAPGDPIIAADTAGVTPLHLDAVAAGDTVTITALPGNGDLSLADGTAVHQNEVLTASQYAGLAFKPLNIGADTDALFQFSVSDGTTQTVNTIPVAVVHGSGLTLTGTVSDDHIIGSPGADVFLPSGGHDILTGGGGADHFVFDAMSLPNATGQTQQATEITDYSAAHGNVLDVSAIVTALQTTGVSAGALFHAVENAAGTAACWR